MTPSCAAAGRCLTKLLKDEGGIVLDVKSQLDRRQRPDGVDLWRL